jgi:hypothetical protein
MRFWKSAAVLFAFVQVVPSRSTAQLNSKIGSTVTDTARQSTSGATRMSLAAPKLTSANPQRIYPGSEVTIAGSDISNATEAQIRVGCIVASDGTVSCANPSATVTAPLRDATSAGAKFTMPEVPGVGDGAPIVLQLAAGRNVGTFASGLALDARPVITAISPVTLKAGDSFTLVGRNLSRVTSVKVGGVATSISVFAGGTAVSAKMPVGCQPNGTITVEETPGPGTWPSTTPASSPSYVTNQSGATTISCSGGVTVVGANPLSGKAGTNITVIGTGFSAVTDVPGFTWSRQSDQQITLVLPVKETPYSSDNPLIPLLTVSNLGGIYLPTLRVLTPPKITDVGPTMQKNAAPEVIVEPGQQIYVSGYGLSSPPYLNPTMKIGSTNLMMVSITPTQIKGTVPNGTVSGALTVSHEGGSITTPNTVWVLSGDTRIEEVEPSVVAPGEVVTVRGQNLFRLFGVCGSGSNPVQMINEAKTEHPWSNTEASFIVPSTWGEKVTLGMWLNIGGQIVCSPTMLSLEIKK